MTYKKKLIEVALPLEGINREALRRKQKAPKGWPTSFHKWWAQRPLAAARAVIFAQMVDDPSANPDLFKSEKAQDRERRRLFGIIEDLVQWDKTNDERVLAAARGEIWQSWRRACANYADHPNAKALFERHVLPAFFDPFAGSGSLPLSAQWLGLKTYASDLNPVAVLINKAMLEIPSTFGGKPPINPDARDSKDFFSAVWNGSQGLADDVRFFSRWMRDEAERRIGHLYPPVEVTSEMAKTRADLQRFVGTKLAVTAWLWARTVKSPNPAFAHVDVPIVSTFVLSSKAGKEAYVEPVVGAADYQFEVRMGRPKDQAAAGRGTRAGKAQDFLCLMSDVSIPREYVRSEAKAGRLGARLMAIVAEGNRGRVYLSATAEQEQLALNEEILSPFIHDDDPFLSGLTPTRAMVTGGVCSAYGLTTWERLFTRRQLAVLTTFSDLVIEARQRVKQDALAAGLSADDVPLVSGGRGALAYADAVCTFLACVLDRMVYYGSSLTSWLPKDNALRDCMPRQALAMIWDYAEANPLGKSSGDVITCSQSICNYLEIATPFAPSIATQRDAQSSLDRNEFFVVSTDPPYYNNISYAELSDFFYVWLRRSLKSIYPVLFSTVAVPKVEELVATASRQGSKEKAEVFFLEGMTQAMHRIAERAHPAFPVTIFYAFKQSESDDELGTTNTGWDTFLDAVIRAGFGITGTWPMRTEGAGRMTAGGTNALASSIVLVCRPTEAGAPATTRREFLTALKSELPFALTHLQRGNIAPVDLAQAAIGPGMAIYTRYSSVLDAQGKKVEVREALGLINQMLDEALAEQEGDFDSESRWALTWFEQVGFGEGEYGLAEQLSKSKNTSVAGMVESGILESRRGKVRLLKPAELPSSWDPSIDVRLNAWEIVHHLIRALNSGGESAAANLVAKLGAKAESSRELAYRLYTLCERKKRATEAMPYNALVQSWPEISRLAGEAPSALYKPGTNDMFAKE